MPTRKTISPGAGPFYYSTLFRFFPKGKITGVSLQGVRLNTNCLQKLCIREIAGELSIPFELSDLKIRLAETEFSYLRDSPADVEVVDGDGRIQLEHELAAGKPQGFDVLVLDAFASDAVPIHLLTREAFELYSKHLNPGGILAFNVTNVYVDLKALIRGTAKQLGYQSLWVDWHPNRDEPMGFEPNSWILVTQNREFMQNPAVRSRVKSWESDTNADIVWTDDYASLLQVLRY